MARPSRLNGTDTHRNMVGKVRESRVGRKGEEGGEIIGGGCCRCYKLGTKGKATSKAQKGKGPTQPATSHVLSPTCQPSKPCKHRQGTLLPQCLPRKASAALQRLLPSFFLVLLFLHHPPPTYPPGSFGHPVLLLFKSIQSAKQHQSPVPFH